jgi:hypothetical protein
MRKKLCVTVAVMALGLGLWTLASDVDAQKTKGKARPAPTKSLMQGVVQPNCAAIGGLIKDAGPKDDKAWDKVALHAVVLNEMSYVVMDDGRCPDKEWAAAAKTLRECSAKLMESAKAKDIPGTRAAFKGLTGACASCHKAHKAQ